MMYYCCYTEDKNLKFILHVFITLEIYINYSNSFEFQAFGLEGDHQGVNAAMAIQLARIWCHEKKDFCESFKIFIVKA